MRAAGRAHHAGGAGRRGGALALPSSASSSAPTRHAAADADGAAPVRAKRRLAAGDAPTDVAAAVGLADQAHLTRAFAQRYGVTPARLPAATRYKTAPRSVDTLVAMFATCLLRNPVRARRRPDVGLVFVDPLLLPEYPAALQSFGCHLAFRPDRAAAGLVRPRHAAPARAPTGARRCAGAGQQRRLLPVPRQRHPAHRRALPTMIIGTLPVVIAITIRRAATAPARAAMHAALAPDGALARADRAGHRWSTRSSSAAARRPGRRSRPLRARRAARGGRGGLLDLVPDPQRRMAARPPDRSPRGWATAQGLATLPLALLGYALTWAWFAASGVDFAMPFGPRPWFFVGLMAAIGLLASWLGTLCWNRASQRLPPTIAGQLIVFETLSALAYAFVLRGRWPPRHAGRHRAAGGRRAVGAALGHQPEAAGHIRTDGVPDGNIDTQTFEPRRSLRSRTGMPCPESLRCRPAPSP